MRHGLFVLVLSFLFSCAAMKRTWYFETGSGVKPGDISVRIVAAKVRQKYIRLRVAFKNHHKHARRPTIKSLVLSNSERNFLLRGYFPQKSGIVGRTRTVWKKLRKRDVEPALFPGEERMVDMKFYDERIDLRRFGSFEVELEDFRVDNEPQGLVVLTLKAPAGAPVGEGI